jgi:pimeloyl-ACP methyl ester carboxylesterase
MAGRSRYTTPTPYPTGHLLNITVLTPSQYENYNPGGHTNNEDAYVGCIAAVVKKLNLKNPIICGASMAGQISLACAIRADEVGCIGTIPLQGSDFLDMKRQWFDQSPHTNQALFNPEWIYDVS